jgi:fused signal recognition particle receptor
LAQSITQLLTPLQKTLTVGEHVPTVIMVAGVNGAGKTTSIGKLTRHLSESGASVLLRWRIRFVRLRKNNWAYGPRVIR